MCADLIWLIKQAIVDQHHMTVFSWSVQAVESSHAVLLQLKSEESHTAWLHQLTRAAYKASVSNRISQSVVLIPLPPFIAGPCACAGYLITRVVA